MVLLLSVVLVESLVEVIVYGFKAGVRRCKNVVAIGFALVEGGRWRSDEGFAIGPGGAATRSVSPIACNDVSAGGASR